MVKFSPNQRTPYEGYKSGTPFDDAGKRVKRMKQRRKKPRMSKESFARRVREQKAQEKAVLTAYRNKDELALQAIAMSCALYALAVE